MKRFVISLGLVCLFVSPAAAINEFSKQWKAEYAGEKADEEFVKTVRRAGCYVCHVKKEKKEVRNEYGKAVAQFLEAEDFPKEYVKANPEEAKMKILAGIKKANELKSSDEKVFGDKIKANELPATDANL